MISKIQEFANSIKTTISFFYQGKILEATNTFNRALDEILYDKSQTLVTVDANQNFYRARINENKHFTKSDLFHIKFELRHIVSTNRYSIPGFPALYIGDSSLVCWDEFNRHKLRDLWFVRLSNTREMKIIQVQRVEDFLKELNSVNSDFQLDFIFRYLVTFPLTIACSIRVKYPFGNFKPEYIIPQLLLQYISKKDDIDGIKFPSTKVDYLKLHGVQAYNYVFPVKTFEKAGFCEKLLDLFHSTEPTSLELDEIIYNPSSYPMVVGGGYAHDRTRIELVEGEKSYYANTSFGKIERRLKLRELGRI